MTDPENQNAFEKPLHVGRPNIGDRAALLERINGMLDRRWLSNNGPLVQEFEHRITDYLGVKYGVAMCNATVALEIASQALGFKDEVIVPSFTFVATVHALQWQGITPVFADIDPRTHNIDPASIEKLITPRTTGIMGVHLWGRGCETDQIQCIADKYGLEVIYDASHGFGCSKNNRLIGQSGACEVFSFHATKFINCFEGGIIVTNDDQLAEKLRYMRNFGFQDYDKVGYLGLNGKMSEVCAAMGLTSFEAVNEIVAVNKRNYDTYKRGLDGLSEVSILQFDPAERNNYQYVVIEIDSSLASRTRDEIVRALHEKKIMARRYFWPGCHRMEPYQTTQPDAWKQLPQTEWLAARTIVLPTGQTIDERDVEKVCAIIRQILK